MDNTTKFDGKAEFYAKSRASYAPALFEYIEGMIEDEDFSIFADIGSGTGIFTEQLLMCGHYVYAVEPNKDMREIAEERLDEYDGFCSVDGTDVNTNLKNDSVDHITVAQAFHWFDIDAFKKECRRILRKDGKVIIVYNTRDDAAPCNKALIELSQKYCPKFKNTKGTNDEKCREFFVGGYDTFRADNSQSYDREGYINRVLSSSYSLREGEEGYEEYIKAVNNLFDTYSKDGVLTVPTYTLAYVGGVGK